MEERIDEKLGFGLMRLPLINDEFSRVDKKMLCDMVDYYLDKGFQYFDTAWFYHDGQSEISVKSVLQTVIPALLSCLRIKCLLY